jgi:hypothetical protein
MAGAPETFTQLSATSPTVPWVVATVTEKPIDPPARRLPPEGETTTVKTGGSSAVTVAVEELLPATGSSWAAANPDINRELRLVNLDRDPIRVRSRVVWDWSIGFDYPHEKPRVGFQFDVRNLTDERRLFNYLSVFSGTHVIPPRTYAARVKYYFY